jgi:pimeloyl-ACP methyl ester carboxylesterase
MGAELVGTEWPQDIEQNCGWLRNSTNGINVVFIHGFTSDANCWRHQNGTVWPKLLAEESVFSGCGIFVFTYRTGYDTATYGVNDIVGALRESFGQYKLFASKAVVFVCHSMGGIVARRFLVSEQGKLRENRLRKIGLFLIASPSQGSEYANKGRFLADLMGNQQAQSLQFSDKNVFLAQLDHDFVRLMQEGGIEIAGKELVEDRPLQSVSRYLKLLFSKPIVSPFSAGRYFSDPFKVPGSDHNTIAKPESENSPQHRVLKTFLEQRQAAWLSSAEAEGVADRMMTGALVDAQPGDETRSVVAGSIEQSYLALILRREGQVEEFEEEIDWGESESPWEVHCYSWDASIFHSSSNRYTSIRESLSAADIGNDLVASSELANAIAERVGAKPSIFADLLQAAVDWMDQEATTLILELFVPSELLGFDWAGVQIRGKEIFEGTVNLLKRHPFTLRSTDRFCHPKLTAQSQNLAQRYRQLLAGQGRWIGGFDAGQEDKLREVEETPDVVALKQLNPLASSPRDRLCWQFRVVEAMVPVALWWRTSTPLEREEEREAQLKDRQDHLDRAYDNLLGGHRNGDPVPWNGCQLDKLPRLRRRSITDPLTRDLVLLLDHPNRHPPFPTTPIRSL